MSYNKIIRSMKVGFMAPSYPAPKDVEDRTEWVFKRSQQLGCTTIDMAGRLEDTEEYLAYYKGLMDKYGVEPDIRTPMNFWKMGGVDDDARQAIKDLVKRCKSMHYLGLNILRAGYNGWCRLPGSRYDPDFGLEGHMDYVICVLSRAAKVLEDEGIYFALENHCDFNADECVEIFDAVDSPMVGCALDTGNGITVFSDPNREYQVLAPYVITTHIKDMKIIPDTAPGHAPYTCSNCDMGDGIVNIPDAIETMARKSKFAKGLHLIAETGANGWAPEYANLSREEQDAVSTAWYDSYVAKLLAFVNSH